MALLFAIIVILVTTAMSLPPVIRIGAIFTEDQKDSPSELAFKYAIYKINKDKTLLANTTLVYDIQYVPKDDSFRTSKKACKQLSRSVQGIFGPSDPLLGAHIQSICEALDVPHLEARVDFEPTFKEFSINLYPSQDHLNKAFKDLMSFLNWTRVAIIYEEDYGLFKLQDLVKSPPSARTEMYIRQAGPGSYRQVLREVRHKEIYKLIVDTDPAHMQQFFRAILQLQMNDYRYHYMFTTFDIETFDLEDFKYNSVNMTAFRLVDLEEPKVAEVLRQMERFQPIGHAILNKTGVIQAEPALVYDSVQVFAHGLAALDRSHDLRPANLSCEKEEPWDDGLSLYNYINAAGLHGLTGHIEFNEGKRNNFKLDLLKLKKEELVKVGEWKPGSGVNVTDVGAFYETSATNITLVVMTREEKPYVMVKEDKNLTGNARFEGFCIDLLKWIASQVGFQYAIRLVPDHMYGVYDPKTKEWNGIVRELMEKRADLAVASMTINYARESVIDFTKPFMNLGIGILFKVSARTPSRLFSFMNPLAVEIWLSMLGAYVMVSLTIWIVARFSPYEWVEPTPCPSCKCPLQGGHVSALDPDSDDIPLLRTVNEFTLANSFWFTVGTLMQQGSDLNPKATSTRIVGGIWWFFTLIIISSYTANLAAFLTVERMITPIENAADLAEQTQISYGTLEGGSTMTFFRDSKIGIYKKMWEFMESKSPSVFVKSYEDGVKRVLEGDYAFLMESTMLDYAVQRDCNLTQIGGLLDSKGYGIATPKGSPWRDKISLAILELQEKGVIQILYDKWWKNTGDVCNRDEKSKESKANALGVENIGGVFVVLVCGLALAILVAVLEFCWNSKKNAQSDRSLCAEMASELRFAMRCGSRQRPAAKARNSDAAVPCDRCSPRATRRRTRYCSTGHEETTYIPSIEIPRLNAGGWSIVDDGDEEIIELRSSGSGPWREHLAQASSSSSSSAAATATTTTATVQSHAHAHTSHTLPLTFTQPQSQPYAQTPTTPTEAETGLFKHRLGSRR
ncbi:glutamate receptor ionotropic, kainate 1 isoform X1 [Apis cerana]|uniref:glutamate receptor ionotropic, kainate 1 isoform X1 n=1 Tax=Apis cerana TaxID=7461 RepID=UPI002B222A6C|nr:glutamate receptor ionotropic, kainate 1 isoform X1 [Apis cerana]XP_061929612.1 glutamate receptor ionotropic, kainate 1 isoform X1 [Apis cerana]XP_061929613.1 glutamate receptor ionotropic, kainate 1 isoform X1 [Apis cerana]XP_061929614.1 glutamate receptor ionotropic, kainate 1 isoform X1 [Apis cerana]